MSVKTMALVWDLDNSIIDREEKYVLLAYADHADHNGCNMYPSINLICQKTGYKERAAQIITRSLEKKGFLIADGKGTHGTNKWRYGGGAENAGVQKSSDRGAENAPLGVQQNAPEPLINHPSKPSIKAATPKPPTPQEVQAFRKATRKYPNSANYPDVVTSVRKVMERLKAETIEDIVIDELSKFYRSWTAKGYNPFNLAWLEWAEAGAVPANGTWRPKNANYQGNTGGESYTDADRAAAERIKARRAGL